MSLKHDEFILRTGTNLYKGEAKPGEDGLKPEKREDWSGRYYAFTESHAKRYGTVKTVTVKKDLRTYRFFDTCLGDGRISGETKANDVKAALGIPSSKLLSDWLAENKCAYMALETKDELRDDIKELSVMKIEHFNEENVLENLELIIPSEIEDEFLDIS